MTVPYNLQYYGTSHLNTPVDITEHVIEIEKFTDVGTGETVSAVVMLDARFGAFVTRTDNNTTPIISRYDLLKLSVTDDNGNTYFRFLSQGADIAPQKNEEGIFITLQLVGREFYMQKMYFPGHYFFDSFRSIILRARDFYNANKGARQPSIRISSVDLMNFPPHAYGVFEFGEKTTVYDVIFDVVKRLAVSVPGGGDGRLWGMLFSDASDGSAMLMRIQAQGSTPNNPITIKNPMTLSEVKQPILGNVLVVKGKAGFGSFPKEPSIWRSLVEEFENLPLWDSAIRYRNGAYVQYQNAVYQANIDHTVPNILPTNALRWNVIKLADYIEAWTGSRDFQLSPYTQDKQAVWRNMGGNPGGAGGTNSFLANAVPPDGKTGFDGLCFTDSNLVIRDRYGWRDWVDFRVASLSDIPERYLYDASTDSNTVQSRVYHGMRVLVDPAMGAQEGVFAGSDKYQRPFRNSMVMMDRDGDWIVIRNARQFDECAVLYEGRMFQYNTPLQVAGHRDQHRKKPTAVSTVNLEWRDVSATLLGNDCFHYPSRVENVDGLIDQPEDSIVTLEKSATERYTDNSAIKIEYEYAETDILTGALSAFGQVVPLLRGIISLFNDDGSDIALTEEQEDKLHEVNTYNIGWWATLFETPFPKSTFNGIGESVGELFGGTTDNKIPIFDFNNLNMTPSGNMGYGHSDSDLLGPIDGFKTLFNFDISGINTDIINGDIPFRATIYDLLGNVWISDILYRFQAETQELNFPLSSFHIYRSRLQPSYQRPIANFIATTINPELKITEIFERRLVKRINLQCGIAYDDVGRYDSPLTWENFLRALQVSLTGSTVKYTGIIDAFHFTKTPVAIARDTTSQTYGVDQFHLIAPIREFPQISNVVQLQKIANAELEVTKHLNDYFTLKFDDMVFNDAEDAVYVQDEDFVSETEKTGEPNTRLMIVKKITYSVGGKNSSSGLLAVVDIFRRPAT